MKILCWYCHKPCSNILPDDTIFRAIAICPECSEKLPDSLHNKMAKILKETNFNNISIE